MICFNFLKTAQHNFLHKLLLVLANVDTDSYKPFLKEPFLIFDDLSESYKAFLLVMGNQLLESEKYFQI